MSPRYLLVDAVLQIIPRVYEVKNTIKQYYIYRIKCLLVVHERYISYQQKHRGLQTFIYCSTDQDCVWLKSSEATKGINYFHYLYFHYYLRSLSCDGQCLSYCKSRSGNLKIVFDVSSYTIWALLHIITDLVI